MFRSLQPLLDTALDAVVAMHRDGTVAAWNGVAERIFGWSEAEAIGRKMAELIIPERYRPQHDDGLARYNAGDDARVLGRRIEISAIDRSGREFPIELAITTAPYADDLVFVGFLRDITRRRETEQRLARQARESQLLFDLTSLAAETRSFEDALGACLGAICGLTGWPVGHALVLKRRLGRRLVSTGVWYRQGEGEAETLRQVTESIDFTPGVGLPGKVLESGEPEWVANADEDGNFLRKGLGFRAAFAFPVKSEGGIIAVLEFFSHDQAQPDPDLMLTVRTLGEQVGRVLERKRTEEHQRLLINELNHRVKNMLAIVQSVASQTFRGDAAEPSARLAFESRLAALAAAHDALTEQNWEAASLRDVVRKTGAGCGADEGRVKVSGPEIKVEPRTAVALGMALHELCTNAVKYGALSNDKGWVEISWSLSGEDRATGLRLEWREQGGPPVAAPAKRGFGSRMIERALASELQGKVQLQFLSEGLRCLVEAPLPADS